MLSKRTVGLFISIISMVECYVIAMQIAYRVAYTGDMQKKL